MSMRTLIEINHDYCTRLNDPAFVTFLQRYLASGSKQDAENLRAYGVMVVGMRHHSCRFILDGTPDGFPALHKEPASPKPEKGPAQS